MNLELHTFKSTRVLKCTDAGIRWAAQENTHKAKFDAALVNPVNTVTNYEDTQAYSDSIANGIKSDKLADIEELKAKLPMLLARIHLDNNKVANEAELADVVGQINTIEGTL